MKKTRLIPLILALSLPIAGCSFEDLMFWKKKNNDTPAQTEKTVTGISEVHAPGTIDKDATLLPSQVDLDLSYSDGSSGSVKAESVEVDTSSLGQKTGKAFYGQFFKNFTIEVVEGGGGGGQTGKTFDELKNIIVNQHNYYIDVESYYQNFPTVKYEGFMANLSNEVYYGTDPEAPSLMVSGYTQVKEQGIAQFVKSIHSDEIVIEKFVTTNTDRTIYDIHGGLIEYIFESNLTKVEDDHYRTSVQDIVGIVGTFSNLELSYVSNPEYIDIVKTGDTIKITSILSAYYYDETTLEKKYNEPVYVGLTIKNIGTTHDELLENFAKSESSKVATPTDWTSAVKEAFSVNLGNFIPPFPSVSYSFQFEYGFIGLDQKYEVYAQDFSCGDIRSSYATALNGQGYLKVGETDVYEKRVDMQEGTLVGIYQVEMKYYARSEAYAGKTFGYYYSGGVFQLTYTFTTEMKVVVSNVGELNTYLGKTAAASVVPFYPEGYDECLVKYFYDKTEAANQSDEGDVYLFTTGKTSYFRIYIDEYSDAIAFYNSYLSAAAAKGFTNVQPSSELGVTFLTNTNEDILIISYVPGMSESSYSSSKYIQAGLRIFKPHENYYQVDIEGDLGVKSISHTSPSNFYHVAQNETVVFSFTIEDGFEFKSVTCNDPSVVLTPDTTMDNKYSFSMPAKNVTITIETQSSSASEGLEYDREYLLYVDASGNNPTYTQPSTTYNKLSMVFKSDGTGMYKRVKWFSSDGHSEEWSLTFSYSLIDGHFSMQFLSGDNTGFYYWRLFGYGGDNEFNKTGVLDSGLITLTVVDGSGNPRQITLK